MKVLLKPELEKFVADKVKAGQYASPEDVVAAGVMTLRQQEQFGDFEAGELNALLAEGERSIKTRGALDGDQALRQRQRRRRANSRLRSR